MDRLAALVESNSHQTENNIRQISDLRSAVASLVGVVEQHQQNFEIVIDEIRQMHSEIRGIQTENKRILDHLCGTQSDQES